MSLDPGIATLLKRNADGLVPAVVQDATSREVLMLAWMNDEALSRTLTTRRGTYWSRSRQQYWVKGETSGNTQHVREVRIDCDGDTLLVLVDQTGPACHTGAMSCFHQPVLAGEVPFSVAQLYDLVLDRKETMPEGAYTTYLFEQGIDKILKKVGEECTEVLIAGAKQDREETVYEIADLVYHVMVLMVEEGIPMKELAGELAGRHVVDKKVKQERMK